MSRLLGAGAGVIGGLILTLLLTTVASASLFLVLTESRGPAGISVRGHTGGNGAFPQRVSPLPTYFVEHSAMDSVVSRDDARLARVGQLVVDASGNGTITVVVPSLPPGPYALMVYCETSGRWAAAPADPHTLGQIRPSPLLRRPIEPRTRRGLRGQRVDADLHVEGAAVELNASLYVLSSDPKP